MNPRGGTQNSLLAGEHTWPPISLPPGSLSQGPRPMLAQMTPQAAPMSHSSSPHFPHQGWTRTSEAHQRLQPPPPQSAPRLRAAQQIGLSDLAWERGPQPSGQQRPQQQWVPPRPIPPRLEQPAPDHGLPVQHRLHQPAGARRTSGPGPSKDQPPHRTRRQCHHRKFRRQSPHRMDVRQQAPQPRQPWRALGN